MSATPLQRAICRIIDGVPLRELKHHPDVIAAIGPYRGKRPMEVIILSAIRAAKSMIAAAAAFRMARTCDLSQLTRGEVARVSIVSVFKDNAQVVFRHLVGTMQAQPWMRELVIGDPVAGSIRIRHETGREVEICIAAGARAGSTLASRWSAGCIFDEAPRMNGQEHVVNYKDLRANIVGRLLPGAQILSVGSPWAPFGPIYDAVHEHWKQPNAPMLVIWAPGWAMNPTLWTPEKIAHLKKHEPDAYITECAAQFASPSENLFSELELAKCTRAGGDLPYDARFQYVAAMDPATRGNAWTLVIGTRDGPVFRVPLVREWVGSKLEPLRPSVAMKEIANVLHAYHIKWIWSDQYFADALVDIGRSYGIGVVQVDLSQEEKLVRYMALKTRLGEGLLDLPNDPVFLNDLKRVRKLPTQRGSITISLPHTMDGRHCDYPPSLILVASEYLMDAAPIPLEGEAKKVAEAKELRDRMIAKAKARLKVA